ncbi:transcription factor MYB114-like [Abrus precatorius]|uniref:Transcription factor MYB114-like n=1 Tax=Abrus precatorius TaxID=3816 RepID=A0A8B8K679_ABRPR|nr:transcription factor MYB114-like [Abrus precatorius]
MHSHHREKSKIMETCGEKKRAWSSEEDDILMKYVEVHGEGNWSDLPRRAGLNRCGKCCKVRWLNYLKPAIDRRNISSDEEELIIKLHKLLGNRWSIIAGRLPGRTETEIENFWNIYLSKKVEEMQENNKFPSTTTTTNSSVQSPNCTKSSLDFYPSEFSHPVIKPKAVRLTKPIMPTQIGWDNQNLYN